MQSAHLQRSLAAFAAAALFCPALVRADDKRPAAWLGTPRAQGELAAPVMPLASSDATPKPEEMKKDELLLPVQGADLKEPPKLTKQEPLADIVVEIPKIETPSLEIAKPSPLFPPPERIRVEPPVRKDLTAKPAPDLNRGAFNERPAAPPIKTVPTMPRMERLLPDTSSLPLNKPTPLPEERQASRAATNDPFLAGTVVPREGGTVFRSGLSPVVKETPRYLPPPSDQGPIIVPRAPAAVGTYPMAAEKPIEAPVLAVPETVRQVQAKTASRPLPEAKQPAPTVNAGIAEKQPQRTITAPQTPPRPIGGNSASVASTGRPMAMMMNTDATGRWASGGTASAPPKPVSVPSPVAKAPTPQVDPKVTQASKTTPAPAVTANPTSNLPSTYSLLPWQWTEKVRTVAGPGAANLVALLSNRGEVKIQFQCADPLEAQAIAGRISAIPEFRKLAIDFEINAK